MAAPINFPSGVKFNALTELPFCVGNFQTGSLELALKRKTAPASDSLPTAMNAPSADIFAL